MPAPRRRTLYYDALNKPSCGAARVLERPFHVYGPLMRGDAGDYKRHFRIIQNDSALHVDRHGQVHVDREKGSEVSAP